MHLTLPVLLFLVAAAVTILVKTTATYVSTAREARADWKEIVARLQPLHQKALGMVARDFLEPGRDQLRLEPGEIWDLVGGLEGLKRMRRNADVMLALAAYTQRWNFEEGVIVAERMRRDARKVHRAVWHIQLQLQPAVMQFLPKRFRYNLPFEVHEIASAYYLMRQRLLALYETSHAGLYPFLAESV